MGWKFWNNNKTESTPLLNNNSNNEDHNHEQVHIQPQVILDQSSSHIPTIDNLHPTPTLAETPSTWSNFVVRLRNIQLKNQQQKQDGVFHDDVSEYSGTPPILGDEDDGFFNEDRKEMVRSKLKMIKKRLPYYVPIFSWLPNYSTSNLVNDAVAGVTTGIMLVPQSMAYALLVGIPSIYGLYTGLIPILFYVIFGTSRQLGVGPEAAVSLIVGDTLRQISEANDIPLTITEMVEQANILAFIVGIVSLVLGLLRFGFLSEVLSRPLVRGFILAIALTIIFDQLDTLLGLTGISGTSWSKIPDILDNLKHAHPLSCGMSIASILILLVLNTIKKRIPEKRTKIIHHIGFFIPSILVVVVLGIVITSGFKLYDKGLKVLGYVDTSFPVPRLPRLNQWDVVSALIQPGLFISIVGFVESMAVSKNFATKHNYQVSTNRELVAIGVSNVIGSIFLAYPMFASMTRSAVNDKAGAKTQLAGFFTFIVILLTCLLLMPIFQYLPKVVMSSIVFVAALGLIEVHDIYFLWKIRAWTDLFLLTLTAVTTFVFNVEVGLIVSIGVSCFMVIKQSSAPHFTVLGRVTDDETFQQQRNRLTQSAQANHAQLLGKYKDITIFTEAKQIDGIIIIRIEESLYFSNIGQVKDILFRIENMGSASSHPSELKEEGDPLRGVIFDMRSIPVVDASSLQTLHEMVSSYRKRGVIVCFVKLRDSLKSTFLRAGFYDLIGVESFFNNTNEAVQRVQTGFRLRTSYSSYIPQQQSQFQQQQQSYNNTNYNTFSTPNSKIIDDNISNNTNNNNNVNQFYNSNLYDTVNINAPTIDTNHNDNNNNNNIDATNNDNSNNSDPNML